MLIRKILSALLPFTFALSCFAAPPVQSPAWKAKLNAAMPLMGHRNWVLVVDSAYPLQSSPGVETIETNASQLEVVRAVLDTIHASIHVRPIIFMDAELPFITEQESPGVTAYRNGIAKLLSPLPVEQTLHEQLIADVGESGKTFHVLVLKTNMAIPYTSVFIRLDCKYWGADQEQDLRNRMKAAGK